MQAEDIPFLNLLNRHVQYVVPRWQRRYCWGSSDIERLVDDLKTVARAGPHAVHYGGTLLTFPEPGAAAGVVETRRVVDGQQRLTTVSILLACIAEKLGPEGRCADWIARFIRDHRLMNADTPLEKRFKLKLQSGDEEEYRYGLDGGPEGPGSIAQAWKITRRLVKSHDVDLLLKGLERLKVVSIGLQQNEDPQQIFESLNATGRPLTESEKVKNWLLMKLPDDEQKNVYDNYWLQMERKLGAEHTTAPIDLFLRDFLRWRTGLVRGIDKVYEGIRRWAVRQGQMDDGANLCRELARLAGLYGIVTGTAGGHPNLKVERELQHLREMGINVHGPLALRLLDDASRNDLVEVSNDDLARALAAIGTWATRLWLSDRPLSGMNRAVPELAHKAGPSAGENFAQYWVDQIRRFQNTRLGVPGDEEVRQGIRTRKAYGGSATRSSFAILCAMMEAEHGEEAPARDRLTVEHVMPQKLTDRWRQALGEEAEETHGKYRDCLANLTLSGDVTNAGMGAGSFEAKRDVYRNSPIGMTRRLSDENEWNKVVLLRRAEDLTRRVLERWPWDSRGEVWKIVPGGFRWRIEDGPWRTETVASQMVLNVASALLSLSPENVKNLSGNKRSRDVYSTDGDLITVGKHNLREIPKHESYVIYPYDSGIQATAERCREMGERCGIGIQVEFNDRNRRREFWNWLIGNLGGIPGQKESWQGQTQWTNSLNSHGERVGISIGETHIWIFIRSNERSISEDRTARMQQYSQLIREQMSDQELNEDMERQFSEGRTISVKRKWALDDDAEWPEAGQWILDQVERLRTILVNWL